MGLIERSEFIPYEYRDIGDSKKCLLKDNINNCEYTIKKPYPFNHWFWHLEGDSEEVINKSVKIIEELDV